MVITKCSQIATADGEVPIDEEVGMDFQVCQLISADFLLREFFLRFFSSILAIFWNFWDFIHDFRHGNF